MTAEEIAGVTGAPLENVRRTWPALVHALRELGLGDDNTLIAAAATVAVECPSFLPEKERGGEPYFTRIYEGKSALGNCECGDGARFCGRGLIQITGRWNYGFYGKQLGIDLIAVPDRALDADVAVAIFATFFKRVGIQALANQRDWMGVRRRVNGGTNGLERFLSLVEKLETLCLTSKS